MPPPMIFSIPIVLPLCMGAISATTDSGAWVCAPGVGGGVFFGGGFGRRRDAWVPGGVFFCLGMVALVRMLEEEEEGGSGDADDGSYDFAGADFLVEEDGCGGYDEHRG